MPTKEVYKKTAFLSPDIDTVKVTAIYPSYINHLHLLLMVTGTCAGLRGTATTLNLISYRLSGYVLQYVGVRLHVLRSRDYGSVSS